MPAGTGTREDARLGSSLRQQRRSERRVCDLLVTLSTGHGDGSARLRDLSAEGAGFLVDPLLALRPGQKVVIRHHRLGSLPCTVRWCAHPRYGVEFETAQGPRPGFDAYYDSLPPAPGQQI